MVSFAKQPKPDDVSVVIDDQEFRYWTEVEVVLSLDAMSTVELKAPWDSKRHDLREVFRPFKFKPMQVLLGGKPLFTGTAVSTDPTSSAEESTVSLSGYSLPGVLNDCDMPADLVPFEFNKQSFRNILNSITKPFGIDVDVRADTGAVFDKVALDVDKKPFEFLVELAKQRNLVLSSTTTGQLLCWKSVGTGSPVATLKNRPAGTVTASFNSQDYFSEITGFAPAKRRKKGQRPDGSKFTGKNPWLTDVRRPSTFKLEDTEKGDAPTAVNARLGRMFANMASFDIEDLPTWRDPQGNLFEPNTTVLLECPDVMIYEDYEFLIRHVTFRASAEKQTCAINVVMPGAFSGEMPTNLPWDESPGFSAGIVDVESEVLGDL